MPHEWTSNSCGIEQCAENKEQPAKRLRDVKGKAHRIEVSQHIENCCWRCYSTLIILCLISTAFFGLGACASKHVEEVVTTDANRSSALPAGAEPIAIAPDLPERDENIEAAGDRIAEAITHLKTGRIGRREAALSALSKAETHMNNALRARPGDDEARTALRAILKDLDAAQRTLQRGVSDAAAARQLAALNKSIDSLVLHPIPEQPAADSIAPE